MKDPNCQAIPRFPDAITIFKTPHPWIPDFLKANSYVESDAEVIKIYFKWLEEILLP